MTMRLKIFEEVLIFFLTLKFFSIIIDVQSCRDFFMSLAIASVQLVCRWFSGVVLL